MMMHRARYVWFDVCMYGKGHLLEYAATVYCAPCMTVCAHQCTAVMRHHSSNLPCRNGTGLLPM